MSVAGGGGKHRQQPGRLARDLGQRPAARGPLGGCQGRNPQAAHQQQRQQGDHRQGEVGTEIGGRQQMARLGAGPRAEHAAEDAAGQGQGDGAALPGGLRRVGCRETVLLAEGRVAAADDGAQAQQGEAAGGDAGGADQRADAAQQRAERETGTASVAPHEEGGGQRRQGAADHIGGERQGRQAGVGSEFAAGEAGDGDHADAVGQQEALAHGEDQYLADGGGRHGRGDGKRVWIVAAPPEGASSPATPQSGEQPGGRQVKPG